jgi:small ligand-binding sensory domain FIST
MSTDEDTGAALAEVCRHAMDQLNGSVDLAVVFASNHHGPKFGRLAESLCKYLGTETLIGCTGESIVGGNREIEEGPAISLFLAELPGSRLTPVRLEFERTPDGGLFTGLEPLAEEADSAKDASLLLLAEPFSFPADALLERLDEDLPGLPIVGGMASGAQEPGGNRLIFGPTELSSGAVGIRLDGDAGMRTIVSQGCRPIGPPLVVTKAERNLILGLGGKPAFEQFRQIYQELPTNEQLLVRHGLHVGVVTNEYQAEFTRGDFLVRNVMGADPESGMIAVGDYLRVGQTVRFHLRDARSADEDLREMLAEAKITNPVGALLFTCNGRGSRMFDEADHDANCIRSAFGDVPVAGFFAQGEIGPIGRRNFLHGFTASMAVFSG